MGGGGEGGGGVGRTEMERPLSEVTSITPNTSNNSNSVSFGDLLGNRVVKDNYIHYTLEVKFE